MNDKPNIYVIDDDDVVRDSLKVLLELRDYRVLDFDSGDQFLAENPDLSNCCVIVDVHMPGMTGLALLALLRDRGATMPAILITGRRDSLIDSQASALGKVVLMDKPLAHSRLFSTIEQLLNSI
jgi:two-component system response regulator FixJ